MLGYDLAPWFLLLFAGTALLMGAMIVSTLYHLRWARRLPPLGTSKADAFHAPLKEQVRCTVVLAARDEESRIEDTVRRLLAQRGVQMDAIVVDDRSTDQTGEIVQRLKSGDSRVQLMRVQTLPDGWLGKCHACHLAASAATGDWILFTDADCWLKSDVVERALRVAQDERADHITLTPGVAPESLGAQAWHLMFLISLANWFSGVNRDRAKAYLGMGAFNLVRTAAYRECGGYQALRMTVLDDMRLGLLLHRAGKRTRGFIGGDDVLCHWGTTLRGMIKIMEKNYFAAIDFNLWLAVAAGVGGTLVWCAAVIGPFTGTVAGVAAGMALLFWIVPAWMYARRLGWGIGGAMLTPLMFPVLLYAVLNSAWVTVRGGGICWRDTFYPLEALRKGAVR